jgi:hypothetical protein
MVDTGNLKDARVLMASPSKQKTLLIHYNKAITLLVERISEPSFSPEIGLVICLLFICIEFMRGDYDTAFSHYKSGINIIFAYRRIQSQSRSEIPKSRMIDETLIPMFVRLTSTAMFFGLPTKHVFIDPRYPLSYEWTFTSLLEAQLAVHNLRNIAGLWMREVGLNLLESTPKPVESDPFTEEYIQRRGDILRAYAAWLAALEDLERTLILSWEDVITINLLKAQHYGMCVFIATAIVTEQTIFDQFLDDFQAVVKHSRIALDTKADTTAPPSPAANFTFEIHIILILYLTACRCRCPTTRREAIALLERNPPREGLWDAHQHCVVAKRVLELEESEVDPATGWPVERARIWSTIIRGDVDSNGRFDVVFVVGQWGEGRGIPPLPEGLQPQGSPFARMWKERFQL